MIDKKVRSIVWLQTPPEVKIALGKDSATQIKLVSVGNTVTGRTEYQNDTEYFFHIKASPSFDSINQMTLATLDTTDANINSWVNKTNYSSSFNHARLSPRWTKGKRTTPAGRTAYLYSADDPDGNSKKIGILVEIDDTTKALKALVVYKQTQVRPDGQLWDPTATIPNPWTLTPVKKEGVATTDPSYISSGWEGWWTLMGAE